MSPQAEPAIQRLSGKLEERSYAFLFVCVIDNLNRPRINFF